jgi:hypothetical protein
MKNKNGSVFSEFILTVMATSLFVVMTVFYQCRHEPEAQPLPDTVSFSTDILPLFDRYCNSMDCHAGGSPSAHLNLSDAVAYDQLFVKHEIDTLQPTQSFLYEQMNSGGTPMPPSGRLSDYDVNLVLKWIEQGAKRN